MNDLYERLKTVLADEESRYTYADSVTNAFITAQIKALREDRQLTQEKLAELIGTKQSGISRWQKSGYSSCKVETLRKLAKAFGVRLRISFEEFGSLPTDIIGFTKERLSPREFAEDPVFNESKRSAFAVTEGTSVPKEIGPITTRPNSGYGICLISHKRKETDARQLSLLFDVQLEGSRKEGKVAEVIAINQYQQERISADVSEMGFQPNGGQVA